MRRPPRPGPTTASPTPAGPMPSTCRRAATSCWSRPTRPAIPTRGTAARASPPPRPSRSTATRPSTSRAAQHVDLGHRQQGRWSRPAGGSYVTALSHPTAAWTNYGVTDAGGAYAIDLPAGSYKLLVQTNTRGLSRHVARRLDLRHRHDRRGRRRRDRQHHDRSPTPRSRAPSARPVEQARWSAPT